MNKDFSSITKLERQYQESIMRKYGNLFDSIAKKKTNFTGTQSLKLGILLDNVDRAFERGSFDKDFGRIDDATTGKSISSLKTFYYGVLTGVFPNLIADELFSVQPLRQRIGEVFFMKYLYSSNKGKISKGDIMASHNEYVSKDFSNYSSSIVDEEIITTYDGENSDTNLEGHLSWLPIIPGSVTISCGDLVLTDDGSGKIKGTGISAGTIDYNSGAVNLTFETAPKSTSVEANYQYDNENGSVKTPEMELSISSQIVKAMSRKLTTVYNFDAALDVDNSFGIDIESELLYAASAELRQEIDTALINLAYVQAGEKTTYNFAYDNTQNSAHLQEYIQGLAYHISEASTKVSKKIKRIACNWLVCGKTMYNLLTTLGAPKFVGTPVSSTAMGPYRVGTFDQRIAVYFNPFFDDNQYLLGYKGDTFLDTGLAYAPYHPFFATKPYMLNDFQVKRGYATSDAMKMVNNVFYVAGVITNNSKGV